MEIVCKSIAICTSIVLFYEIERSVNDLRSVNYLKLVHANSLIARHLMTYHSISRCFSVVEITRIHNLEVLLPKNTARSFMQELTMQKSLQLPSR